jgi:hypothetical protein
VLLKIVYLLVRRILGLAVLVVRKDLAKDAELLALRHENAVLRRHAGRIRYELAGRVWFAALARLLPRGAGAKSSPRRPRRCWPGTANWPLEGMTRAAGASPAARRPPGLEPRVRVVLMSAQHPNSWVKAGRGRDHPLGVRPAVHALSWTSCFPECICQDLTRADRDPAWPLILAQLEGRAPDPLACDAPLAAAVAAQAAAQVLAFIDRPPSASAVTNGTLELVLPGWQWRRRTWMPHQDCSCSRPGHAGPGPGTR